MSVAVPCRQGGASLARWPRWPRWMGMVAVILGLAATSHVATRAATPGIWEKTESMKMFHLNALGGVVLAGPRCGDNCGKVLVAADNDDFDNPSALSELYDPESRTWEQTGELSGLERKVAMTLLGGNCALHCGKVLAVGYSAGGERKAGLYDPDSGTWEPAELLPPGPDLGGHTLTGLLDGRALIVHASRKASLYDPVSGHWSSTRDRPGGRNYGTATATLLQGGKVLFAGAQATPVGQSVELSEPFAQLYDPDAVDPATGRRGDWSSTSPMGTGRHAHSATLLPNGQVLAAGGFVLNAPAGAPATALTELWTPSTGRWTSGPPMAVARGFHTATLLPCGVLVAGGTAADIITRGQDPMGAAEVYVLAPQGDVGAWASTGPLNVPRYGHGANLLGDGTVLVAGGLGTPPPPGSQEQSSRPTEGERYTPIPCEPPPLPDPLPVKPPDVPGAPPLQDPQDPTLPVVVNVDPRSGPVAGGTRVAITGVRFAGATAVRFGDEEIILHPCPAAATGAPPPCFTEESPTRITAYSPVRSQPAVVHVRVATPAGISVETQADLFEYTDAAAPPGGGEAPGPTGLPGPPGGSIVTPAPPGGSPALSPSPGGAPAPGNALAPGGSTAPGGATAPGAVGAPGGSAAPGGSSAPSSVGSTVAGGSPLPMVGGAGAPSPGVAGMREEAPDLAPESGYNMVAHEGTGGPDPRGVVLAGMLTLIACTIRVSSARRERSRSGGCGAPSEAY